MSRTRAIVLLVPYLAVLLYLTLVYHPALHPHDRLSLVPFRSVVHFWNKGGWPMAVNIVGNVGAFIPLGFLLPSLRSQSRRTGLKQAALGGAGISLAIEVLQYLQGRRVADVDDVILNLAGTVLGYLLFRAVASLARLRSLDRSRTDLVPRSL